MNAADMHALVDTLDGLAEATWDKVQRGPARGMKFGEESLTDHNLFELDRACPAVEVYKFDHPAEALNGADFEWYIGGRIQGWVGLRFQAKKLDDGAYAELGHRVVGERQYDLLLRRAADDDMWPFYCFYNGWDGPWPTGVVNATCPANESPRGSKDGGCIHAALEHFGCAIAPAHLVAARHRSPVRRGRLELDDYLARSRPWSHLFRRDGSAGDVMPSRKVATALEEQLASWSGPPRPDDEDGPLDDVLELPDPPRPDRHAELPAWLAAVRRGDPGEGAYRPKVAAIVDVERS